MAVAARPLNFALPLAKPCALSLSPASVIARLPRPFAFALLLGLGIIAAWCMTVRAPAGQAISQDHYSDLQLYRDVVSTMQRGQSYYPAVVPLHRAHNYPLRPFFTVRLPTLAELAAHLGWRGTHGIALGLLFLTLFVWVIATEGVLHWTERVVLAVVLLAGAMTVIDVKLIGLHEIWAGLFMAIALAGVVGWPRQWWWIVLPIACALAIRELVLPFALLALVFAVYERRWSEVAGWLATLGAFGVFLAVHAVLVHAQLRPADLPSPGWHGMLGLMGFLNALVESSLLQLLGQHFGLLAAALGLFGWCALDGRRGLFCLLLWGGYVVMFGLFERPDNFYWGAMLLPGFVVGLVLLPRACWQLMGALRGPAGRVVSART